MSVGLYSLLRRATISKHATARLSSFKSDLSLDKIYPGSTEIKPFSPPQNDNSKFTGYIPIKELEIKFVKASGPGGQHVNKTSSKAVVRFHVKSANWLSENTKNKILEKCVTKINKDGYLVISSEKTREALINRMDAVSRMRQIIYESDQDPPEMSEETAEKLRKRQEAASRRRLEEKRRASLIKRMKNQKMCDG
ncbi:UNVERIFIED_CONTAM: hypothetical protein PYX00_002488 [Menopon gallinae]|uniref:Large ribosomal subunit protein mL62 n=1 Tax=Menopon gallinae TaxID=328185 RepID=A0AAW2IJ30_9NEOP